MIIYRGTDTTMSIYETNLAAFRKRYPESAEKLVAEVNKESEIKCGVAEVEDRNVLYVEKNGEQIQLDSLYDSAWIIDRWCEGVQNDSRYQTALVFGLGNGMFVRELSRRLGAEENGQIIVYEPELSVLRTVLSQFDISGLILKPNIHIYIEGITKEVLGDYLDDRIDLKKLSGVRQAAYPNYPLLYPVGYEKFLLAVRLNADAVQGSMDVEVRYGEKFYQNILSNIPAFIESLSLESLKAAMPKDFTAVIVSSGPSLSGNIKELKRAAGKCLMIAVDSALPPLFAEDIQPDIYMCVDANKPVTHFQQERTKKSAIVTALPSIPGAMKEGQKIFFERIKNDYIEAWLDQEGIKLPEISTGGTVANSAYQLAEYLGAKTILMVGQDLAYTGEKAHADNNLSDNNVIRENTIVHTVDIYGNPIRSSSEFMLYKDWFERRISDNRDRIQTIDATEGGAYIQGSIIKTLREAIDENCREELNIAAALNESRDLFNEEQKEGFRQYIAAIPQKLNEVISDARRSIRNYDKMYQMAKLNRLSKGELERILRDNDAISNRLDHNPVMSIVEYLIQDSIKNLSENAYKTNRDVRDELIEASTLGKEHSQAILSKAEWIREDIANRTF